MSLGRGYVERLEGRTLLAAPVAAGPEFPVNTHAADGQVFFAEAPHAVASDADGDFVVTWSSSGQDGGSWGVYAQRFDRAGGKWGGEFLVNQVTGNSQWYPTVAADADGDFVVSWTSYLQDGSQSGVYSRRYGSDGAARGDEFRVNSTTAGDQRHSSVAADADGDFVVVWAGNGPGGVGWDVYGQRYSAAGAKRGGEFRINQTTAGDQQYASVAVDSDGDFVVAWTSDGQDGSGTGVYARRYDAAGAAEGDEFRVNTFTDGNQQYGRVAAGADGAFVVAWASAGQDGGGRGVFAQQYDALGRRHGGEFAVNEVTAGEQFAPTVSADAGGGFVVTWTGAADGDLFGVFGRAYEASGAPRGGEFRVNSTTVGNQVYSNVAADAAGGFVVAWQSERQDGDSFGIFGQRYAPPGAVTPAVVVGRHLFYNDSAYDGRTPGADPADDGAIAADKVALLDGAAAGVAGPVALSLANYSGYSRGLNGVMVDIARPLTGGVAGAAPQLTADDFAFSAGNGGSPDLWKAAPPPASVSVRAGAGIGGSDRVTLVWADGAIHNQWLRLTVRADARTGLAAPDVFYYGSMPGETGDVVGSAAVDRLDAMLTRRAVSTDAAPMSSPFDHDRDGQVDAGDVLAVRRNMSKVPLQAVSIILPPAPAASDAKSDDDEQQAWYWSVLE